VREPASSSSPTRQGLSQNQALEALIVGQSDQDTFNAMAAGSEVLWADKSNRLDLNRELSHLTEAQRAALLAAVTASNCLDLDRRKGISVTRFFVTLISREKA
jgi:hypothetical protein